MTTNINALPMTEREAKSAAVKRFWMLSRYNLVMYLRNRAALFWVIFFPIGYMLLFGTIYGGQTTDPNNPNAVKIISFMVPGLVAMSLMSNGIIGNAAALAILRERGILRRVQTTPLSVWQMLLSRILVQSIIMVGQAFILIGMSIVVLGASFDALGVIEAIPFIILSAILCMAIGQTIAALIGKTETVQIVTQVVFFPLLFLSGLFIPLQQLPEGIQAFGKYLPSAMVGDLIRAPMLNGFPMGKTALTNLPFEVSLVGTLLYLIVFVVIATRFFRWK